MRERMQELGGRARQTSTRVREWLRRVMPRVGIAAVVLLGVDWLLNGTYLYEDTWPGVVLQVLFGFIIVFSLLYWSYKALRWLKQRVLWRVRGRLAITYLFVGLTPVVLLLGLGFIFAMALAVNEMVGEVTMQADVTRKQALANSRAIADALAALPPNANDRLLQQWLDERNRFLQASLPGARIALWRATAPGEDALALAARQPAQIVSEINDERTIGFGDQTPINAPLPEWTKDKSDWSGFTFVTSTDPAQQFAAPAFRVVQRRETGNNQSLMLLMVVPMNRTLVERYRDSTGIPLRPFFADLDRFRYRVVDGSEAEETDTGSGKITQIRVDDNANEGKRENNQQSRPFFNSRIDQLGEPLGEGNKMFVVMPTTNWLTGEQESRLAFLMPVSRANLIGRIMEKKHLGQNIPLGMVLKIFGIIFLVLEGLAILACVWMTRAVTGTVHKLY
ncbi:MAG: hypothetical protein H0V88_12355, partial [Pyrinomonadaceae bacterium]|nr:hypothetical protein [Pyrinomonadaceae bacterium]